MSNKWITITVVSAENLPAGDSNGLSDPYVTVDWSVGNKRLLKSSVKPATLNPEWNEEYQVEIDIANTNGEFLISVKDKDFIGCDRLGYLVVPLKQILKTGELSDAFALTKKLHQLAETGYGRLHLKFKIQDYDSPLPLSRSPSMSSQHSQSDRRASNMSAVAGSSGDHEKRFLYAQEDAARKKSITEQMDDNVLGD